MTTVRSLRRRIDALEAERRLSQWAGKAPVFVARSDDPDGIAAAQAELDAYREAVPHGPDGLLVITAQYGDGR